MYPSKKKGRNSMKNLKKLGVALVVSLCVCMLVSFAVNAAGFSDTEKHWAKEYIEFGVEKGYISGYEDGTFKPDKTVSRAEFSKMINNAIKLTAVGTAKADFTDVASKDWFFNEVKKAENAGYITGYEDGSFRPSNSVTRQEAAVILSRIVFPIFERAELSKFGDGTLIDSWATDAVTMIAAKGYIKGDEKGNFSPKGALTRSQAAKLICEVVRNENVVNRNQNITSSGKEIIYSESLFTDDIVIDVEEADELFVTFKNCRILGSVYIKTDDAYVTFENTKAKALSLDAENAAVTIDKASEVKNTEVAAPAELSGNGFKKVVLSGDELSSGTVKLSGTFDSVAVGANAVISAQVIKQLDVNAKVSLVLQAGTVEKLTASSSAKGASINLAKKVVVEDVHNKAAVAYTGSGTIENANNEVTGVTYDGVTVEKTSGKVSEGAGSAVTSGDFFKDVEITPAKGKTNQAISVNFVFTFLESVYNNKGDALTADYIEDSFEIRKGSASGSKVAFEAKVSSNKKITLDPILNLANSTTYYVVVPKGTLTYGNGTENDKYETYFKTAAAKDEEGNDTTTDDEDDETAGVTMTPKSGATNVSIATTIKLTFDGTLKAYSSSKTFDADYIEEEAITIYEGSTSGDEVSFSASISGKTITLTPSGLLGDTKYYVVIGANKIKVGGTSLSKTTLNFTTEAGVPIKISPESGATNVSTLPEITVTFSEPVLQVGRNHDPLDESYIVDEVVLFRVGSATTTKDDAQISFSVTEIAENGRKFVIVPDEELESGKTYYIVVQEETLYGEVSKEENEKVTSSFKTASAMAPMFTPYDGRKNASPATDIKIAFSDELLKYSTKTDERVAIDDDYLAELVEDKKITLKRGSSKVLDITATLDEDGKTIIITPDDPLEDEKTYTVSVATKIFYAKIGNSYKYNTAGSATFDTNIALSPTITPKNEAEGVAVTVNPTIKFEENVFSTDAENRTLKPKYLKENVIKLVDEYGNDVDFTASATETTITVKPEKDLEGNTEYTLTLVGGTITNEDGEITNAEKSVTFTTKVSYTYTFTPENSSTDVSPLVNPTVRFGVPVLTTDDEAVDAEYAYDYIFMSVGSKATSVDSTSVIPTTIEVGDDGRTFTLIPDEILEFGKKYYIVVLKNGFHYDDDDGKSNAAANSLFTVIKEPAITNTKTSKPKVTATTNTVKITCTSNVKGEIVVEDESGTVVARKTNAKVGSNTIEIKELEADTEYTFNVYVIYEEEIESAKVEVTAKTKA